MMRDLIILRLRGKPIIWDFGDGSPTSTDFEPTHVYTAAGTYHITMIAYNTNTCNGSDTAEFDIQVFNAPIPDFSFAPDPPLENTPTTFTNLSSPDAVRFQMGLWRWGFLADHFQGAGRASV